jgi:hypothetical protein
MGLKGYRLWVMGQRDSNVQSPTTGGRNTSPCCKRYKLHLKSKA